MCNIRTHRHLGSFWNGSSRLQKLSALVYSKTHTSTDIIKRGHVHIYLRIFLCFFFFQLWAQNDAISRRLQCKVRRNTHTLLQFSSCCTSFCRRIVLFFIRRDFKILWRILYDISLFALRLVERVHFLGGASLACFPAQDGYLYTHIKSLF